MSTRNPSAYPKVDITSQPAQFVVDDPIKVVIIGQANKLGVLPNEPFFYNSSTKIEDIQTDLGAGLLLEQCRWVLSSVNNAGGYIELVVIPSDASALSVASNVVITPTISGSMVDGTIGIVLGGLTDEYTLSVAVTASDTVETICTKIESAYNSSAGLKLEFDVTTTATNVTFTLKEKGYYGTIHAVATTDVSSLSLATVFTGDNGKSTVTAEAILTHCQASIIVFSMNVDYSSVILTIDQLSTIPNTAADSIAFVPVVDTVKQNIYVKIDAINSINVVAMAMMDSFYLKEHFDIELAKIVGVYSASLCEGANVTGYIKSTLPSDIVGGKQNSSLPNHNYIVNSIGVNDALISTWFGVSFSGGIYTNDVNTLAEIGQGSTFLKDGNDIVTTPFRMTGGEGTAFINLGNRMPSIFIKRDIFNAVKLFLAQNRLTSGTPLVSVAPLIITEISIREFIKNLITESFVPDLLVAGTEEYLDFTFNSIQITIDTNTSSVDISIIFVLYGSLEKFNLTQTFTLKA